MSDDPQIIYQKHTFFSAIAMGLCALAVALIVSGTAVVITGMHLVGRRADRLASFAEDAVRRLPSLRESLPPAFAGALDDQRRPDYCEKIELFAETKPLEGNDGTLHTTVKVINGGDETVSLLSLRVVVLNARGQILAESNQWAATPVTAEPQWRGPLLPRYLRYVGFTHERAIPASSVRTLRTEVEITDIRICPDQKQTQPVDDLTTAGV